MRIAKIEVVPTFKYIKDDWSAEIYVCGCKHRCPECHNKQLWDFNYENGVEMTAKEVIDVLNSKGLFGSVVYLGGDFGYFPKELEIITKEMRKQGKDNILYTGFNRGELNQESIQYCDMVLWGVYNKNDPDKLKQMRKEELNDK